MVGEDETHHRIWSTLLSAAYPQGTTTFVVGPIVIRPSMRCRHLTSHVLGRALRRVGADFEARYYRDRPPSCSTIGSTVKTADSRVGYSRYKPRTTKGSGRCHC